MALVSIGLPLASTASGLRIDLFEGGRASGHGHDHAQVLRRSSQFVGGGNTGSWLWPRRIALRDLRALFFGTITLLAGIILMSGSGRAALDLGGVYRRAGLDQTVLLTGVLFPVPRIVDR